jgi:WD40 repeat protein
MIVLTGPTKPIQSLSFSSDETKLYAVHGFVGVHEWDLSTQTVKGFDTAKGIRAFGEFVVHPDGKWAFGRCPQPDYWNDSDSRSIDLTTGKTQSLNFIGVSGQNIAISSDGKEMVTIGAAEFDKVRKSKKDVTRLYGWKMTAKGPKYQWHRDTPDEVEARSVVFVDEDHLLTVNGVRAKGVGYNPPIHQLSVRSANNGKIIANLDYPETHIDQILASPDGKYALARLGTSLWVWNAEDWKKSSRFVERKHSTWIEPLAAVFHPSSRYLLLAVNGPSVAVIETGTWREIWKWKWEIGTLRAVTVSRSGNLAAAATPKGKIVVWDLDL